MRHVPAKLLPLAIIAVLLTIAVFTTATGEKKYYIEKSDGSRVEVDCVATNRVDAFDSVPAYAWNPPCVSFFSGQKVTWYGGLDFHDPGSNVDEPGDPFGARCFLSSADQGGLAPAGSAGDTYTVKFYYDGVSLRSTFDMVNERLCPGAIDLEQSGLGEAVLPYTCYAHPWMQALLVVKVV